MPQTRSGAKTSADATKPAESNTSIHGTDKSEAPRTKQLGAKTGRKSKAQASKDEQVDSSPEKAVASTESPSEDNVTGTTVTTALTKSKKRSSTSKEGDKEPAQKKSKSKRNATGKKPDSGSDKENQETRPRLRTPDIEFDFDRSQLRDPCPTPGRKRRYRHEDIDLKLHNPELKKRFETEFYIPTAPKPKGRLDAFQKDDVYCKNALLNPLASSHDKQKLEKRGPNGAPVYDRAGFQLDYDKYVKGSRGTYNKTTQMNSMDRALEKGAKERAQFRNSFFDPEGGMPDDGDMHVYDFVKDHISKDLGLPWHQVGGTEAAIWEGMRVAGGQPKISYNSWWKEPNEVEKQRMMKLHSGCVFRKNLKATNLGKLSK